MSGHRFQIGVEVGEAANQRHQWRQPVHSIQRTPQPQTVRFVVTRQLDPAPGNTSNESVRGCHLQTGDGPGPEEPEQVVPAGGSPGRQRQGDLGTGVVRRVRSASQRRRSGVKGCSKRFVEPADAAEAGGEGHVGDGQRSLVQQHPGQPQSSRLSQLDGAGAHDFFQLPTEVALADPQPSSQAGDAVGVDHTFFDQHHRLTGQVGPTVPFGVAGGQFRAAPAARPKPGLAGAGGMVVEANVGGPWGPGRARRTAEDAGGGDAGVKATVESGVPPLDRVVTDTRVEVGCRRGGCRSHVSSSNPGHRVRLAEIGQGGDQDR